VAVGGSGSGTIAIWIIMGGLVLDEPTDELKNNEDGDGGGGG